MTTLAEYVGGKDRVIGGPFGSKLTQKDYVTAGVPVIRGSNMGQSGRFIGGNFVFVSGEKVEKDLQSNLARPGDIVVTQRGTLGQVSIIGDKPIYDNYVVSQSQMAISVDRSVADPLFVYYYLTSDIFNDYIERSTIQTGVPHINLKLLRDAPVDWPALAAQREISQVLGALDDKIEANRRMNETLEAMAQAIFRDWFVDFGPARRKQEGATDPVKIMGGITQNAEDAARLADLFPDAIGDDGLPQRWEQKAIGEELELLDSKRIPLSGKQRSTRQGPYPYHGATGVMDHIDDYLFDEILLLVGEDGSVAKPDGRPFTQYVWGKIWVNNHAHVIRGLSFSVEQLKCFFDQVDIGPYVTGAVQPKLNQGNLKSVPFMRASDEVHQAFDQLIQPLFGLVRARAEETKTLTETRDLLLPRLMSGEVTLKDAEAAA